MFDYFTFSFFETFNDQSQLQQPFNIPQNKQMFSFTKLTKYTHYREIPFQTRGGQYNTAGKRVNEVNK